MSSMCNVYVWTHTIHIYIYILKSSYIRITDCKMKKLRWIFSSFEYQHESIVIRFTLKWLKLLNLNFCKSIEYRS